MMKREIVFIKETDGMVTLPKEELERLINGNGEANPVWKGRWEGVEMDKEFMRRPDGSPIFLSCSVCNGVILRNDSLHWNYCPSCGAYMDNGKEYGK